MANHKSAKKRIRQNEKRRVHNKSYLSMLGTKLKVFKIEITEAKQDKTKLEELNKSMPKVQSALQKAASKGLIHRKNASRRIGRLVQQIKAISA